MMHKNKKNIKTNANKNQEMEHMNECCIKMDEKRIDILILCQKLLNICIKCKPKILKSYILYAKIHQIILHQVGCY